MHDVFGCLWFDKTNQTNYRVEYRKLEAKIKSAKYITDEYRLIKTIQLYKSSTNLFIILPDSTDLIDILNSVHSFTQVYAIYILTSCATDRQELLSSEQYSKIIALFHQPQQLFIQILHDIAIELIHVSNDYKTEHKYKLATILHDYSTELLLTMKELITERLKEIDP
ncbi:unnamed protein product [Didymodactylos carnosus]|uniref:Uncharacterized protein n=1 Tax=Didymodactylos carnosus TaxID=1234261 RepID=A0A815GDU1_9BILA|nr:unnamed protein product [Didymodactylos carnosus]CAF4195844.1 unnamed protein product [Didymodactylos carnosus]